jgi:hypothetical protein
MGEVFHFTEVGQDATHEVADSLSSSLFKNASILLKR